MDRDIRMLSVMTACICFMIAILCVRVINLETRVNQLETVVQLSVEISSAHTKLLTGRTATSSNQGE